MLVEEHSAKDFLDTWFKGFLFRTSEEFDSGQEESKGTSFETTQAFQSQTERDNV